MRRPHRTLRAGRKPVGRVRRDPSAKPFRKVLIAKVLIAVALVFAIVACATQPRPPPNTIVVSPGILSGLLHGFILPFSLIGSLFTNVRVYAFPNAGFFYDLRFFLGAAAILGGGGASARR